MKTKWTFPPPYIVLWLVNLGCKFDSTLSQLRDMSLCACKWLFLGKINREMKVFHLWIVSIGSSNTRTERKAVAFVLAAFSHYWYICLLCCYWWCRFPLTWETSFYGFTTWSLGQKIGTLNVPSLSLSLAQWHGSEREYYKQNDSRKILLMRKVL